jgi:hypothetical protein
MSHGSSSQIFTPRSGGAEDLQTLLDEHKMPSSLPTSSPRSALPAATEPKKGGFTCGILIANELHHAAEIRASLRS